MDRPATHAASLLAAVLLLSACAERAPSEADMAAAARQWMLGQRVFCMDSVTYTFLPHRLSDPSDLDRYKEVRETMLAAGLIQAAPPRPGRSEPAWRLADQDRFCYAELGEVVIENWAWSADKASVTFRFKAVAKDMKPWAPMLHRHGLIAARPSYTNAMQLVRTAKGWAPPF